jgi:hypothetical protein
MTTIKTMTTTGMITTGMITTGMTTTGMTTTDGPAPLRAAWFINIPGTG